MLERIQRTASTPERLEAFLLLIKHELGYQLHEAVQRTKFALSASETAEFAFESGPVTIRKQITRADFEKWVAEEIASMSACVDRLMTASGLACADIDRVFGRGRLRMVTGDHVEVFREHSLPGERRRKNRERAEREGMAVPPELMAKIRALAGETSNA